MIPHYESSDVTLYLGDCVEAMKSMPNASVDAICTDPPYGISFMGKEWDDAASGSIASQAEGWMSPSENSLYPEAPVFRRVPVSEQRKFQQWTERWASEALRVLKPGGYLLSFCATRTYHRMASGIEDAGFEIRDSIGWVYATGYPKNLDVSKQIDNIMGAERMVETGPQITIEGGQAVATKTSGISTAIDQEAGTWAADGKAVTIAKTLPASEEAQMWAGWGTALKPAIEPIAVARKALDQQTVAANVLLHGTGAINVKGTAIPFAGEERWPSNLVVSHLDECGLACAPGCPVAYLTALAGFPASSVYFCPKPNREEKEAGLGRPLDGEVMGVHAGPGGMAGGKIPRLNVHPTVKPINLMRWLIRMVTPPGGVVFDPFMGSGTTGCAAVMEERKFVGADMTPEYMEISKRRIEHWGGRVQLDLFA